MNSRDPTYRCVHDFLHLAIWSGFRRRLDMSTDPLSPQSASRPKEHQLLYPDRCYLLREPLEEGSTKAT